MDGRTALYLANVSRYCATVCFGGSVCGEFDDKRYITQVCGTFGVSASARQQLADALNRLHITLKNLALNFNFGRVIGEYLLPPVHVHHPSIKVFKRAV